MTSNIPPAPAGATGTWPAWRPLPRPEETAEIEMRARRALRRQGSVRALIGLAIAALLVLWKPVFAAVVALVAVGFLVVALAAPGAYARISAALERFGYWIGMTLTWILMPMIFFLLFLPVGLALRAAGKLRITRGADPSRASYWDTPPAGQEWGGGGAASYRRQF